MAELGEREPLEVPAGVLTGTATPSVAGATGSREGGNGHGQAPEAPPHPDAAP